jgi:hypothetical protein
LSPSALTRIVGGNSDEQTKDNTISSLFSPSLWSQWGAMGR